MTDFSGPTDETFIHWGEENEYRGEMPPVEEEEELFMEDKTYYNIDAIINTSSELQGINQIVNRILELNPESFVLSLVLSDGSPITVHYGNAPATDIIDKAILQDIPE